MSGVKEFFDNIKERLSSPFFFSFITAWLLVNWKITVALFTSSEEIHRAGYVSIFDLISCQLESAQYGWPIAIALFYTFVYPFVRSGIDAFNAWINREANYLIIRIANKDRLTNMQLQISESNQFFSNLDNKQQIEGNWIFSYKIPNENEVSLNMHISEGKIYFADKGVLTEVYHITNFFYDSRRNKMLFIKEVTPGGEAISKIGAFLQEKGISTSNFPQSQNSIFVCDLKWEHNRLHGTENRLIHVTYTKESSGFAGRDPISVSVKNNSTKRRNWFKWFPFRKS